MSSPRTPFGTTYEGYLSICVGPMFSGKTKHVITTYNRIAEEYPLKKQVVVNFVGDVRYGAEDASVLTTHDGMTLPSCLVAQNLSDILHDSLTTADVVHINEAQFFQDLVPCVLHLVNELGKRVFVSGLDGDFRHERFGTLLDLIPECDEIVKLRAVCGVCSSVNRGIYSQRLTGESEQVVIGSSNYVPVCRKCALMQKSVYE